MIKSKVLQLLYVLLFYYGITFTMSKTQVKTVYTSGIV